MGRRKKQKSKRSRNTRIAAQKRRREKSEDRNETEVSELDAIDYELSGVFAVLVMTPLVIVGICLGYVVAERSFGPGKYEVVFALVGGVLGGALGWLIGRPVYRLFAGPARVILAVLAFLTFRRMGSRRTILGARKRSLGRDISDLLFRRRELTRSTTDESE